MLARADVDHVAKLARLALTDGESETMAVELSKVLDHIDKIRELDLSGVEPTAHVIDIVSPLRPDTPEPSLSQATALAQAPEPVDGGFGVPSPVATAE